MTDSDWSRVDAIALDVLARNGGVARIGAFLTAGLSRHQLAALRSRGVVDRPRNAWYVDPALPWQAKCAIRVGGVLACASAAASYGLPIPPESQKRIEVLMPHNAPRVRHSRDRRRYVVPGEDVEVELHWAPEDGTIAGWRTSLLIALLMLAGCVSTSWWIAALDAALHSPRGGEPLLDAAAFAELRARLPDRLAALLDLVDPRSESCIETLLRLGLIRRGIGPVTPQFSPDGRRRVDFLIGDRLIVEADGAAFHDSVADAARDAEWRRLGYTVLRFSYDRIVHDLEAVLDEIAATLAAC